MRFRLGSLFAATLAWGAVTLQAADGYSIQVPMLGYVLDAESGSLRPIHGIPGASRIGDPLDLGLSVRLWAVSADQRSAIIRDDSDRTFLVDLSTLDTVELVGALPHADGLAISPRARTAVIHSSSEGRIQIVQGLGGEPTLGEPLDLPGGAGNWSAFAISDSGTVLASSLHGETGSLYMVRPVGRATRVGSVQKAADLAFFPGLDDAVVADSGASEVLLIRDLRRWRRTSVIATANDGVTNPFGVSVTANGSHVVAAVPGGIASIPLYGGQGGQPVIRTCACTPTGLDPLAGGDVFRLTGDLSEPLQIAQVGAEPQLLFVPALPPDATQ